MATRINGTGGADTLAALNAADTLAGGTGDDLYILNARQNVIEESPGYYTPDGVFVSGGVDTVRTAVTDRFGTVSMTQWPLVENLRFVGAAAARLVGNARDNDIRANPASLGNDTLVGGSGNDTLYGYGGNDALFGDTGSDDLDGGVGQDIMAGGRGDDTYRLDSAGDVVIETFDGGSDTLRSSGIAKDLRVARFANCENLVYTEAILEAKLSGNDADNRIESRSTGNDSLSGWAGNDILLGGGGDDSIVGGEGSDTLVGGSGVDTLAGGNGNDVYFVSSGDVVSERAGAGIDSLVGGKTSLALLGGIENLFYNGTRMAALAGNALDNILVGGSAGDIITGGLGNDSLYGGNSTSIATGTAFHFSGLAVGASDQMVDVLNGGLGDDRYHVADEFDVVLESDAGGSDVLVSYIDNSS